MLKSLSQSEFDGLSLDEKGRCVFLGQAKFLGERMYYNQKLLLYDMGDFFAQVWYEPLQNKIHNITSLSQNAKEVDRFIDSNTNTK